MKPLDVQRLPAFLLHITNTSFPFVPLTGLIRTTDTYVKYYHATIENRVSILDSILDSREDRESSVNFLLNGTVLQS